MGRAWRSAPEWRRFRSWRCRIGGNSRPSESPPSAAALFGIQYTVGDPHDHSKDDGDDSDDSRRAHSLFADEARIDTEQLSRLERLGERCAGQNRGDEMQGAKEQEEGDDRHDEGGGGLFAGDVADFGHGLALEGHDFARAAVMLAVKFDHAVATEGFSAASAAINGRNCGMRLTGNDLTHDPRAPLLAQQTPPRLLLPLRKNGGELVRRTILSPGKNSKTNCDVQVVVCSSVASGF